MGLKIRDIVGPYLHEVTDPDLKGKAAVDAFNTLYQFLSIIRQPDGTPLHDEDGRVTSHLSGIFFRTANLLKIGVKPVWVFDGTPSDLKQKTISYRRSVREEAKVKWEAAIREGDMEAASKFAMATSSLDEAVIQSSKELLSLMGIPIIEAPSEGEAQAAHMVRKGDLDYVISQDYDTLLFNTPVLVRNLTISGRRRMHGKTITVKPERIELDELLNGLSISREDLIDLAILIGTDFNEGVPGVGAKTGLKKIKSHEFESTIREKIPGFDPSPVKELFRHPKVTDSYSLNWESPEPDRIRSFLCDSYGFSPDRVDPILEKMTIKREQKTLDSWF